MGAQLFRLQELKERSRSLRTSTEISTEPRKLHLSAEDIALPSSQNSQSQKEKVEEKILSPVKNTLRRSDSEVIASPVKKSLNFNSPSKTTSSQAPSSSPLKSANFSFVSQSAFEILPTPSPFKSPTTSSNNNIASNNNNTNTLNAGRSGLMQSSDVIPHALLNVPISEKMDQFYSEVYTDDINPSIESDFDLSARSNANNINA